jgi:glycosyltransferase involved in cell wall biosynthesis
MRVGWDARILVNGERRGMGTYAFHVLRALRECRPDVELTLFHDQDGGDVPVDGIDAREIGPKRGYRWQLWERVGLPFHAYTRGCDLVHSPANTTPPRCPVPRVVTLHDALPFHDWNESAIRLPYFRDTQRRAIKRADAIITDSQYSKSDICDTLNIEPSRVTVIPLASSPDLRRPPSDEVAAELARLQLTSPFIVALGATARRKNTRGVLRAFAALQHADRDVTLVLTGVGPQLEPMLVKEMEALAIATSRVRCLGFVDQQQLAALYTACDAFWFLSLYEGFGLPILDAMRCGAVVVCSTRTSCPEVGGDAAMMVDPEDVDGVAAATLAALAMDGPTRARWRARGEAHAANFTWQRTAAMTAQVYNTIAGNT